MKIKTLTGKAGNILMYAFALLFLGYHIFPVLEAGYTKVSNTTSVKTKLASIQSTAECTSRDGLYDRLTYGNPLTDPLWTTLPYQDPSTIPVTGNNLLPNASFTEVNERTGLPEDWQSNQYGRIAASTSLARDGHTDQSSLKVTVTSRDDGDAKWVSAPIDVTPGEYFRFEDYYKSDAQSNVIVDIAQQDGNHYYVVLGSLEPTNGSWQDFRTSYVVPAFTEKIQLAHVLDNVGTLQTDDYKLVRQPLPQFKRGLVSLTFDDGWRSIHDNAMPLFDKYDIKTTQFVISGSVGDSSYMTSKMLKEFAAKGHEIGSHSAHHEDLSRLGGAAIIKTLAESHSTLNDYYGFEANNFAAPYGRTNNLARTKIKQCYQSMRTTDTGFNAADYDRYNLKVMNIEVDTKPEEVATAVRFARDHKLWLIMVYHEVDNSSASSYAASLKDLEKQLQILKEEQVAVVTYQQGLSETLSQIK